MLYNIIKIVLRSTDVVINAKFDEIIVIFTDQNGRPLEIEVKVNLTFLINK